MIYFNFRDGCIFPLNGQIIERICIGEKYIVVASEKGLEKSVVFRILFDTFNEDSATEFLCKLIDYIDRTPPNKKLVLDVDKVFDS